MAKMCHLCGRNRAADYRGRMKQPKVWWRKYRNRRQKLTNRQYAEIRLLHKSGESTETIGQLYNISTAHVTKIVKGK